MLGCLIYSKDCFIFCGGYLPNKYIVKDCPNQNKAKKILKADSFIKQSVLKQKVDLLLLPIKSPVQFRALTIVDINNITTKIIK